MPSDKQLSTVLSEFARTLVTDFAIQEILDHLVRRIVDVLPITAAGVTLIAPGAEPRYVAASDESALRFEELQSELGEGPCLVAYETGKPVAVADLRKETRYPRFGPQARDAGLAAVFTFPLYHGDRRLGALDLYRDVPGPLDESATAAAQTLADVASAYLINAQARADLQESSDRSNDRALHDALTGLPNRALLFERIDHANLRGRRSNKMAAVLFADIDRFKLVNDFYGHGTGDELLVAIAERVTAVLRPGDTLARLSGDEFVILCVDLDSEAEVHELAGRIGAAIAPPFVLSSATVCVTASVGIAFSGREAVLSAHLLEDADAAMYQAKRKGGARHQIVDLREQRVTAKRVSLEGDLHGASGRGELANDYLPIVDVINGGIVGAEALLRWAQPGRGSVPPTVLVPLAERSGLMNEIGPQVLERACRDRQRWPRPDLGVAVNVSAQQLMSSGFVRGVADVFERSGTDPHLVTLEITEGALVHDPRRARVVLAELRRLGVQIALDDFGTGYSSLACFEQFPIDIVKVDRTLIAKLGRDKASDFIVGATVDFAHLLGLRVSAEGVETADELQRSRSLGFDSCQGYYLARPMPSSEFATLALERLTPPVPSC